MMERYLEVLEQRIRGQGVNSEALYVMQSNGGVARINSVMPITTVLSGPCAGAIAGIQVAEAAGFSNVLSLDMGGTSTDIAIGQQGRVLETTSGRVGDWELAVPMLMINTIGAGGGTMASIDGGGGLRVGPESAGADPGPVCYGQGGTSPTVTDANLVLGFLNQDAKLAGRVSLNRDQAFEAIDKLGQQLGLSVLETAEGIVRITNAKMQEGIRAVSTEQGYDLREFALVAFGGGGPVPAGRLAADLRMANIVIPPNPGVTSALGLLMADPRRDYVTSRLRLVSELSATELSGLLDNLRQRAETEFIAEGYTLNQLILEFTVDIRYLGQGYELTIPLGNNSAITNEQLVTLRQTFDEIHEKSFGHSAPEEDAEAVNYRLRTSALVTKATLRTHPPATVKLSTAQIGRRDVCFDAQSSLTSTPIYDRSLLGPGHIIAGPAIIEQLDSTTVVYPHQRASVDDYMNLVITGT